ncbi:PHA/PHB synthase family protein [Desulfoluna butyratoxydans]|uniref:Alpha/beta hydrolase fold n=1 Tax=Desulfoluna butyratoxydans TaxID=231438 RepID=A0A4U8YW92_9BACT|nr:alpha/beta fold hydrolase [Desulfoluna butyratoxydans]VFQ45683.1 alpha/beta hydrolase fold [Desulfoluna butyratoxydans]
MRRDTQTERPFQALDTLWHALQGRGTMNFSPVATALAAGDWAMHLANSPAKQTELWMALATLPAALQAEKAHAVEAEGGAADRRFNGDGWAQEPFCTFRSLYSLACRAWGTLAVGVPGVEPHHGEFMAFMGRQVLELGSPYNYLATNPELLRLTREEKGGNLMRGLYHYAEDMSRLLQGMPPAEAGAFEVGRNLAVTDGEVIYRNRLMELIQYRPSTSEVFADPVLIVPAWIMKYYILDLSAENSMVKYLVDQGHTVFMVSWKNPATGDRDLDLEDYMDLGIMAALDKLEEVVPDRKVHGVGYCLGGTLFAIAAAAMARDGDERLKSLTLMAAQTDFTEAGELMLFIDPAQLSFLEDIMRFQGYLDTGQMAGAFQLLRAYDLIWSQAVARYLKGERRPLNALMTWNADATRMPSRMHSRYLRELFLDNDFSEGRFEVKGRPVVISDIHVPIFLVATQKDHVAPWTSVYKFHLAADARSITFVLTAGGHNSGIVSEPGHAGRSYRIATRREGEIYVPPERWLGSTPVKEGSWWVDWQKWLMAGSGQKGAPPAPGRFSGEGEGCVAPGSYVYGR